MRLDSPLQFPGPGLDPKIPIKAPNLTPSAAPDRLCMPAHAQATIALGIDNNWGDEGRIVIANSDIELRCISMTATADDRDLYGGLIRLHVLHRAGVKPLYGHWMIEELRRHGYHIGPGTMYPLLHRLERKGYLRSKKERRGSRYRKVYTITLSGRRAVNLARRRVQELFGEVFAHRNS